MTWKRIPYFQDHRLYKGRPRLFWLALFFWSHDMWRAGNAVQILRRYLTPRHIRMERRRKKLKAEGYWG